MENFINTKERLNKQVNSSDLDIRIKAKREARKLGFAVIPVNDRYEVIPTKKMLMQFYYAGRTDLIEAIDERG